MRKCPYCGRELKVDDWIAVAVVAIIAVCFTSYKIAQLFA